MDDQARIQLDIIRQVGATLGRLRIRFWLRGGWAVDFMLGEITRPHADIDLVVWARNRRRVCQALTEVGFVLDREIEVQTDLRKGGQDISIIYLTRSLDGRVVTHGIPVWAWPPSSLPLRAFTLAGVRARAVSPEQLLWEKESYEQGTGRPLRPKDVESMKVLRSVISTRQSGLMVMGR
ncbi:MAG: nucleotidyltransferase domain-containing protein [Dehalococcoidia bacterium]